MEEIILKLLVTDTTIIQQATAQLRDAYKNPESTKALYELIISSKNSQVRQYAALLLRRRYSKGKNWSQLPELVRKEFKSVLLQSLVHEPEKLVKNAVVQLVGVIVKHEMPKNQWPEALQLINQLIISSEECNQELGMYALSIMTEMAPDVYLPHVQEIIELVNRTLCNNVINSVSCYALDVLLHLSTLVERNQIMVNAYHQMMPRIMHVIHSLVSVNPEKTMKGFDLMDELCENAPSVVSPHVVSLVEMCIRIVNDKAADDDLKMRAVIFIGWLAKMKKKTIVKHKLIEPIIDVLFSLMCEKPDDDDQEVYFSGEQDNTLITSATQTLDLLALHLPPEKLVPYTLKHIETGLENPSVYANKASYLAMAVLAEGCSEYIRTKYLECFLRCICKGITNATPVVRNAAFFALGQFSEHLQPEISRYADELLPVLFQYLSDICTQIQGKDLTSSVDRVFYALEIFAENLNEGLLPYLPTLMAILIQLLENESSPAHVRELALSAVGAAANASKENIYPYFEKIMCTLQPYLLQGKGPEEDAGLQVQAVDTLGVLARTVGEQNFAPLAGKSLEMAIGLLRGSEDPDLKKSVYGLLASISSVMKGELSGVLPVIVEYMLESVKSSEGIVAQYKDEENELFDNLSDSAEAGDEEDIEVTDDEDDDEDVAGYSVENAYIEEKEEAVLALREIAEFTEEAFSPYLETCFEEVFKLLNYPQEDIRKAAVDALTQFCINFSKTRSGACEKAISVLVPKLSELTRLDQERSVVIQALDAFSELLEHLKADVLVGIGHREAIVNCIADVLCGRTECQDDEGDGDEGEAEHDELLFECAGQVLVNFGKVIGPDEFAPAFKASLPIFLKHLSKNHSEAQRSYCIGTIAECLEILSHQVAGLVNELLPIFVKLTNDPCDEVRSNAIFGLGELAFHGKEVAYPHYSQVLQVLSNAMSKEVHAGARDNIIGAIARLIISNRSLIPLEQVFPVFMSHIPLKEDLEENKTVFKCLITLHGEAVIGTYVPQLVKISVDTLESESADEETKRIVGEFIKLIQQGYPNEWSSLRVHLSAGVVAILQSLGIPQ